MMKKLLGFVFALSLVSAPLTSFAMEEEEEAMQAREAPEPADDCAAMCEEAGSEQVATRDGSCQCANSDGADVQEAASACNGDACRAACAPNQCVGWRPNASGGCTYSCLVNTATPDRTVN